MVIIETHSVLPFKTLVKEQLFHVTLIFPLLVGINKDILLVEAHFVSFHRE